MRLPSFVLVIVALGALTQSRSPAADADKDVEFFEKKIRPVLAEHCFKCHAADAKKVRGGLVLDTHDGVRTGGDSGPAVVPGDADKSLLIQAVRYKNADTAMPPKNGGGKLPDAVIRDLEEWVKRGAPDPRGSTAKAVKPATDPKTWWAYQPIKSPTAPQPRDAAWPLSDIDRFVRAAQEAKRLAPVGDAEPATLLRRVSFDLTGLPPTPAEQQAFVAEWNSTQDRQAALARVVDRLLASPQFGERWGRHWLDVARYAESSGKDVNVAYSQAWRYRDYVVRSFNADKPYDRFLREQIAGDHMPATTDAERAELLIATGFLAVGPKSLNEMNPKQFAVDVADEQIDTVTQAVLGLTVACARCHDHKFDPIPQREYTALAGVFLSTETRYGTPGGVQGRNQSTLVELPAKAGAAIITRGMSPDERRRKQGRLDDLRDEQRQLLAARASGKTPADGLSAFDVVRIFTQAAQLQTELESVNNDGSPKPLAMGVCEKPTTVPRMRPGPGGPGGNTPRRRQPTGFEAINDSPLFARGDVAKPSDIVPRGVPHILPNVPTPTVAKATSGRLELTEWLTARENPLTARVMANRAWHWLFGRGLVPTVDNFGISGSAPSHPELLDYLATRFVADGWSVKKLVRSIVLSRTYQLAATHDAASFTADPDNSLLWRHSPRRLDAEEVRDAMLAAAGSLDLKPRRGSIIAAAGEGPIGGPRNMSVSEEQIARADNDSRSIYLPVARNVQPAVLAVFDLPDAATPIGAREATNVPAQALFLLNGEFTTKQAKRVAGRVVAVNDDFDARFTLACRLTFGRDPEPAEAKAARSLLARHAADPTAGWTAIARALFAAAEFRYLD
jgi:hypothetical protein